MYDTFNQKVLTLSKTILCSTNAFIMDKVLEWPTSWSIRISSNNWYLQISQFFFVIPLNLVAIYVGKEIFQKGIIYTLKKFKFKQ